MIVAAVEAEDEWFLNIGKLLITLNSGSIVALLAMSQALLANGHFCLLKLYLLVALAVFLIGICTGVAAFNVRRIAWLSSVGHATPHSKMFSDSSHAQSIVTLAISFVSFMAGAIVIGVGMSIKL
jgi:hypothetical protein